MRAKARTNGKKFAFGVEHIFHAEPFATSDLSFANGEHSFATGDQKAVAQLLKNLPR